MHLLSPHRRPTLFFGVSSPRGLTRMRLCSSATSQLHDFTAPRLRGSAVRIAAAEASRQIARPYLGCGSETGADTCGPWASPSRQSARRFGSRPCGRGPGILWSRSPPLPKFCIDFLMLLVVVHTSWKYLRPRASSIQIPPWLRLLFPRRIRANLQRPAKPAKPAKFKPCETLRTLQRLPANCV